MRSTLALAAVLCLALTGCGSDGDDKDAKTGTTSSSTAADPAGAKTEDAAKEVVEGYISGFFGGDPDTCDLMTPAYQQDNIDDAAGFDGEKVVDCAGAVKLGQEFSKAIGAKPEDFKVTGATLDGDTATVTTDSPEPFEDTVYTLAWQGDRWLIASDDSGSADDSGEENLFESSSSTP